MSRTFLGWFITIAYDVFRSYDRRAESWFDELITPAADLPSVQP